MASAPATFSCPHCHAPLRLRQRPAGTLELPCPDCGRPLELSDQLGDLLVRSAGPKQPSTARRPVRRTVAAAALAASPRRAWEKLAASASRVASNPLAVTWLAAGAAAILLAAAVLRNSRTSTVPPNSPAETQPDQAIALADGSQPVVPAADPPIVTTPPEPAPAAVAETHGTASGESRDPVPPVVAPKPPASPPVDPRDEIAARLAQRVLRFEQATAVPFETLRLQLEDLAGVEIRYGETAADPKFRQAPITLALSSVTLAAVLDEAAAQAGLERTVEATGVTLVPAGGTAPASEPVSTATR